MKLKKRVFAAVVVLVLFSASLAGAQEPEPKNAISIDALGTTVSVVTAAVTGSASLAIGFLYQRVVTDNLTLALLPRVSYQQFDNGSWLTIEPWLELDWHPFDKGLKGFFVGPDVVASLNWDTRPSLSKPHFFGIGASVGYQFLLGYGINVDLALGYVPVGLLVDPSGTTSFGTDRMHIRIEVGVGLRF